jgi:hypothetical protein
MHDLGEAHLGHELGFKPGHPSFGDALPEWRRGSHESVPLQGIGEPLTYPEVNQPSIDQTAALDATKEEAPAFTPFDQAPDHEAPLPSHLRFEPCARRATDEICRGRILRDVTFETTAQHLFPGSLAMAGQPARTGSTDGEPSTMRSRTSRRAAKGRARRSRPQAYRTSKAI